MNSIFICKDRYRQIVLFLAIFQSCGIRLFSGIGVLLSIIIFLLCIGSVRPNLKYVLPILFFSLLFLIVKGMSVPFTINCILMIINAFFLIEIYRRFSLVRDLYIVLYFLFIQAMIGFVLAVIVPDSLWIDINATIPTQTLGFLFYRPSKGILFGEIYRMLGLAWEPGCMQLFLNLLLFLKIRNKEKIKSLIWVIVAVILTGSTVGYLILMVNALYYVKSNNMKTLVRTMWILIPLAVLVYPFLESNIVSKMGMSDDGAMNSSGVVRYRDFYVGLQCLLKHPVLGIDMSDLANNSLYQKYETQAIESITGSTNLWYQYFEYAAGGYTNGFFGTTMLWGLFGIYMIYNFIKSKIWRLNLGKDWIFMPLMFCLTFISEPITNTIIFYFIAFYNLYNKGYVNLNYNLKPLKNV